jgi:hypothetical protein
MFGLVMKAFFNIFIFIYWPPLTLQSTTIQKIVQNANNNHNKSFITIMIITQANQNMWIFCGYLAF